MSQKNRAMRLFVDTQNNEYKVVSSPFLSYNKILSKFKKYFLVFQCTRKKYSC